MSQIEIKDGPELVQKALARSDVSTTNVSETSTMSEEMITCEVCLQKIDAINMMDKYWNSFIADKKEAMSQIEIKDGPELVQKANRGALHNGRRSDVSTTNVSETSTMSEELETMEEETSVVSPLFDFGSFVRFMTNPLAMCEATGDFVGALPTGSEDFIVAAPTKNQRLSGQTAPPSPDDLLEDSDDDKGWPSIAEQRTQSLEEPIRLDGLFPELRGHISSCLDVPGLCSVRATARDNCSTKARAAINISRCKIVMTVTGTHESEL
ncbi:unnamed protein product [Cladocopium goreaui]|uniref:Uncharacterized protein n=1 Tax=Cladocopium goreaui TaxID=2562237 RepID=A0A9P1CLQ1_9DINO|nr:unnamed protein product [Cladocopium goreaui]